jgi:peroxiredoxin
MKHKLLSLVGLVLIIAGVGFLGARVWSSYRPLGADDTGPSVDAPVPAGEIATDFKLKNLAGQSVELSALKGKVVFLNVWATWCGPCREEMPSLESLYESFKNRKDFVMLAVSQDRNGRQAVQPYVEQNHLHFEVLLDPDNTVGDAYNVTGVPETFIIDRTGRIVAHHIGAFDWSRNDIREALNELLNSKES